MLRHAAIGGPVHRPAEFLLWLPGLHAHAAGGEEPCGRSGRVPRATTMSETDIPAAAGLLLRERVHTFEQLEALAFLVRGREDSWPADAAAEALRIPEEAAREAMLELAACGLVVTEPESAPASRFRYSAATSELETGVAALMAAYQTNRLGIVKMMSDNAIHRMRTEAMRAFSDAFLIGRKNRNG